MTTAASGNAMDGIQPAPLMPVTHWPVIYPQFGTTYQVPILHEQWPIAQPPPIEGVIIRYTFDNDPATRYVGYVHSYWIRKTDVRSVVAAVNPINGALRNESANCAIIRAEYEELGGPQAPQLDVHQGVFLWVTLDGFEPGEPICHSEALAFPQNVRIRVFRQRHVIVVNVRVMAKRAPRATYLKDQLDPVGSFSEAIRERMYTSLQTIQDPRSRHIRDYSLLFEYDPRQVYSMPLDPPPYAAVLLPEGVQGYVPQYHADAEEGCLATNAAAHQAANQATSEPPVAPEVQAAAIDTPVTSSDNVTERVVASVVHAALVDARATNGVVEARDLDPAEHHDLDTVMHVNDHAEENQDDDDVLTTPVLTPLDNALAQE